MSYSSVSEAVELFKQLQSKLAAYNHAMGVISLDAATAAPSDSWAGRGKTMAHLSQLIYDVTADPENGKLLQYLEENRDALDAQTLREAEVFRREYDQLHRIPADLYVEYSVLLNDAQAVWEKAKNQNDFPMFAPYLKKIVAFNRQFAGFYNPSMAPYDALLNEYEEGLDMLTLDAFFAQLRESLIPLIHAIQKVPQIDDSFLYRTYPVEQQKKFSDYLMGIMGLDPRYCAIAETEHPFTTSFNNKDVRITTHYFENDLQSSMFSVIHEGGHALYELGAENRYNETALRGGVSMGIHESQSRFYENIIGRSESFAHAIIPKIKELFPEQFADVDENMFYRAINKAEPSLVRILADELTYAMHIMVRYELEKKLIAGELEVEDVPQQWNVLYKEYLGVEVPNDTLGCLQDTHWAGGMIGYFPSYALGSAYGAQMLHVMESQLGDIYSKVAEGDLSDITEWLRKNIHSHASFVKPRELFERVCGKFDSSYYTEYLVKKYSALYGL